VDGGEWSDSHSGRITSEERLPVTHWVGDWTYPSAGLDAVTKK